MKLKLNKFQITLEVLAALVLIGTVAYLVLKWGGVPDKIPGHYNATGEVDRWGNKSELLLMPIISGCLYLFLTVVGFFPSIWNIPVHVTEDNKAVVYRTSKNMMITMKLEALVSFFYLEYNQIGTKPLSQYFLFIILVAVLLTFGFYFLRLKRIAR